MAMKPATSILRTLDLSGGSLVPFVSMPGERVRILAGSVWLTEEGNPHDAFLASGEEISLGSRGLAVVEALGPARIQLVEDLPGRSPIARGAARLWRRAARWIAPRALVARGTV
jgi:hypothetical protein